MIALFCIYVLFLIEAWLELVVIKLKNGSHPEYEKLNSQEHFRSAVYAAWVIGCALLVVIFVLDQYWLIPPIIISRRLFFDWPLAVWRNRPLHKYEGNDWWAGFLKKIFGPDGRYIEHIVGIAVSLFFIVMHCIKSNENIW